MCPTFSSLDNTFAYNGWSHVMKHVCYPLCLQGQNKLCPSCWLASWQMVTLSLGQVFVAVKKWESCIYFQRKLHLCAGSCIYAHIWLRKAWHNLFSFAWTWPKAKIFRSSTSNWVRTLSYLAGVVKLLACKPMRRS